MKSNVSSKIHTIISMIHNSFMQPKHDGSRKQSWIDTWTEIKNLSPFELNELSEGLETTIDTLNKLNSKTKILRIKKEKDLEQKQNNIDTANQWEQDEFLDSSADLPVFKKPDEGRKWVEVKPIDKPKTVMQTCQAIWVTVTNRAIYLADSKGDNKLGSKRDSVIEKHRLAVLPAILDDKTVADVSTGKPIMNLYFINREVKENLLWLLCERAKVNENFRKLYIKFLRKEIIKKAWNNRISGLWL